MNNLKNQDHLENSSPHNHILINSIINANCLDILPQISSNSIDLTITSPPYDNLRDYQGFQFNFEFIAQELYRIIKPGGIVVWIIGDSTINGSETGSSFKQALGFMSKGFKLHDTMIYQKSGFAFPSKTRYHQIFEYMFVFSKGKPKTFNPLIDRPNKSQYTFSKKRRKKDGTISHKDDTSRIKVNEYGMRFNIWRYKTGRGHTTADAIAYEHPALFPEALAKDHILSWSNEGDLILDPLNGAGTTTKMAYMLNRRFIGIDISEKYCKIALERLNLIKERISSKFPQFISHVIKFEMV
ncbi:DNA-methyltransferase [Candidatus Harpocratesius sp.]